AIVIDIRANYGLNGQSRQILLVEVKCFADSSEYTRDLYVAIGQYVVYQAMLNELKNSTPLYLAIPLTAYDD
ncbi:MAG TPA: element excision factor XisH family protein, partial [Aggregatilineales bacterium]|nr:element excision factor XisH family protein [Aggregatilineales bacterium]